MFTECCEDSLQSQSFSIIFILCKALNQLLLPFYIALAQPLYLLSARAWRKRQAKIIGEKEMKNYINGKNITVGIITLIIGIFAVVAIARTFVFRQITVSGNVVAFTLNPEGKVDGAILDTSDQIKFGMQTGELVSSQIKIGDALTATGHAGSSSSYGRELRAESLQIGDQTITVVKGGPKPPRDPKDRPHPPRDGKPGPKGERPEPKDAPQPEMNGDIPLAPKELVKANGKVQFVIVGAKGEARGVILTTGEQMNLPKEVQDAGLTIDQNTDIAVEGDASKSDFGTFIKPTTLTIGNRTFSFNR